MVEGDVMDENLDKNFPTDLITRAQKVTTHDGDIALLLVLKRLGSIALQVEEQAVPELQDTLAQIEAALSDQNNKT